jgi:hypothetical protein
MDGLYSKTSVYYFLVAYICVLPGILAAAFGRGLLWWLLHSFQHWRFSRSSSLGVAR